MNIEPKIQEQQKLKKKAVALLSKAIAKIILKFRLPRSEFINALDEKLVLEAKRQDPEASNVAIAIRTGIARRYIGKHLKGEMPKTKPDKMAIILEDIRWTAQKYYQSNKIPKTGPFKTFQSICEERASGMLTYNAILEELIKNGNVREINNKIELINLNTKISKNEVEFSHLTSFHIDRISDTIIYNSTQKDANKKLIQRTVYTTQVNPNNINGLHKIIQSKFKLYNSELTNLIISYEEDVNVGTYPEYGISYFEYQTRE